MHICFGKMFCVAFSVSSRTNFPQNWNTSKALSHSASSSGKLGFNGRRGCLFFLPPESSPSASRQKQKHWLNGTVATRKWSFGGKVVIEMHLFFACCLFVPSLSKKCAILDSSIRKLQISHVNLNRRKWSHQNNASSRKFTSDKLVSGQRAITSAAETIKFVAKFVHNLSPAKIMLSTTVIYIQFGRSWFWQVNLFWYLWYKFYCSHS